MEKEVYKKTSDGNPRRLGSVATFIYLVVGIILLKIIGEIIDSFF
jgi:hypothetical protein